MRECANWAPEMANLLTLVDYRRRGYVLQGYSPASEAFNNMFSSVCLSLCLHNFLSNCHLFWLTASLWVWAYLVWLNFGWIVYSLLVCCTFWLDLGVTDIRFLKHETQWPLLQASWLTDWLTVCISVSLYPCPSSLYTCFSGSLTDSMSICLFIICTLVELVSWLVVTISSSFCQAGGLTSCLSVHLSLSEITDLLSVCSYVCVVYTYLFSQPTYWLTDPLTSVWLANLQFAS